MRIFITPRKGLSIRDPLDPEVRLPEDGDWRDDSRAYRRLARAGDITISQTGPAKAKKPAAAKSTPKKEA